MPQAEPISPRPHGVNLSGFTPSLYTFTVSNVGPLFTPKGLDSIAQGGAKRRQSCRAALDSSPRLVRRNPNYPRPPSQHVSTIVWQRVQCSLWRISIRLPPHAGQARPQDSFPIGLGGEVEGKSLESDEVVDDMTSYGIQRGNSCERAVSAHWNGYGWK